MSAIITAFSEGGPFMFVILALGAGTILVVGERYRFFYLKTAPTPKFFRDQVRKFIQNGDLQGATALSVQLKNSAGEIIALGCQLRSQGASDEILQARMDEKLSEATHKIDRNTGFLGMLGNVATLVGLLGTISGMIRSFAAVAQATPMDRATMLSRGISEAMNCTAFGLVVAIPALVAYAIFQNKTDRVVYDTTDLTTQVYHDLLFTVDTADVRMSIPTRSALIAESHVTV